MTRDELERLDDKAMSAWDQHDVDAFASVFADSFVWRDWTLPEPIRDRAGLNQYFGAWMTAFPDMRVKTARRVIGDDSVAAEVEWTGTHTGPMAMGPAVIPPTGKAASGRGAYIAKVRDGKVVEFNSFPDVAGVMMQLGLIPQPTATGG